MEESRRYASRLTSFSRPLPPVGWHESPSPNHLNRTTMRWCVGGMSGVCTFSEACRSSAWAAAHTLRAVLRAQATGRGSHVRPLWAAHRCESRASRMCISCPRRVRHAGAQMHSTPRIATSQVNMRTAQCYVVWPWSVFSARWSNVVHRCWTHSGLSTPTSVCSAPSLIPYAPRVGGMVWQRTGCDVAERRM